MLALCPKKLALPQKISLPQENYPRPKETTIPASKNYCPCPPKILSLPHKNTLHAA